MHEHVVVEDHPAVVAVPLAAEIAFVEVHARRELLDSADLAGDVTLIEEADENTGRQHVHRQALHRVPPGDRAPFYIMGSSAVKSGRGKSCRLSRPEDATVIVRLENASPARVASVPEPDTRILNMKKHLLPVVAILLLSSCTTVDDFGAYWDKGFVDPALEGTWKKIGLPGVKLDSIPGSDKLVFVKDGRSYSVQAINPHRRHVGPRRGRDEKKRQRHAVRRENARDWPSPVRHEQGAGWTTRRRD